MEHLPAMRKQVVEELLRTRIVQSVLDGTVDRDAYARYLVNAYNYAQYSPRVMALGASRALATHPELASYLLHHATEETGHDLWALADLGELGVPEAEARSRRPVPACSALIGYIHFVAGHANPIGLFGWMYVLEAVGNDIGTEIGRRIDEGLKLGGKALRFVAGHGIADADHTTEITEKIQKHLTDPGDLRFVEEVAEVVGDLYLRMFREIGGQ
jgi:pyrroloquinoline quinone (PQQ) biosynthesis protein C